MNKTDAVIIGGGPAGSATATLLARQGLSVTLFEKQTFPRFHIGESLLPGSIPFLEELGVHDQVKNCSVKKPGGKWYYGSRPVFSDFSCGDPDTSFSDTPYAYMVKREEFDDILLKNAAKAGARVFHQHTVTDVLQEGERVVGVMVKDDAGIKHEFRSDMVFDCSGYGAVIPRKFKLRRENRLKRMAVFGHYRTTPLNPDLRNGWFIG
jgi:flavin-dependent dehydrogenase